ncbi:hypothetical protein JCM11491_007104 [Sporobolomyces phaffii]
MFFTHLPSHFHDTRMQPPRYRLDSVRDHLGSSLDYDDMRISRAALERALVAEERRRLLAAEEEAREWERAIELSRMHRMQEQDRLKSERADAAANPFTSFFDALLSARAQRSPPPATSTSPSLSCPIAMSDLAHPSDATPATPSADSTPASSLARDEALSTLSTLASSFSARKSSFNDPTSFTFQAASSSNATPRLAFGSANAAFLSFEDFLVTLLSKIDAVDSHGDRHVKHERKQLVKQVEHELARLDAMRERAWEGQLERARGAAGEDEEMRESVSAATERRDPVSVPARTDTTTSADEHSTSDADLPPPSEVPSHSHSQSQMPTLATPHLDEDDEDPSLPLPLAPLTHAAVSSLPMSTTRPTRASSSPARSDSGSSTLTVSSTSSQVDEYIAEMLRRANQLGERVEAMEFAEQTSPAQPSLVVAA